MPIRRFSALAAVLGLLLALLVYGDDQEQPGTAAKARPAPDKAASKAPAVANNRKEAEAAVAESAEQFAAAYNRHDAKAAAAGYTATGEFVTEDGTAIQGRDAIERHLAGVFKSFPKISLQLHIDSIRLVTSTVAIEEGRVEVLSQPGAASQRSRYVALHLNQEGQWRLALARDFSADGEPVSNHDRLRELEWLVGEWVEEGEGSLVSTSCKWSSDRSYLLQEFAIRLGNEAPVSGMMRIGWDPQTQQIKSWTFDSDGGYSEALWARGDKKWVLKSKGVTHSGRNFSRTAILRSIDEGTMSWETRDHVEAGILLPDHPPLVVKRRPPPPGE